MRSQLRRPGTTLVSLVLPGLLVLVCDDPQGPAAPRLTWWGSYDPSIAGRDALTFTLEPPSSGFQFVVADVTFEPLTGILAAEVAIQNTWHRIVQGPSAVGFADFDPASVRSAFTVCDGGPYPTDVPPALQGGTEPPATASGSGCFVDYRDTYGPEGALYTGESSKSLRWSFLNRDRRAFSFRVWLEDDAEPRPGEISGVVFEDANRNGRRDPGETGIPDAYVVLERGDLGLVLQANHVGHYAYQVGNPGTYRAAPATAEACRAAMPAERIVSIARGPSGVLTASRHVDFGCGVDLLNKTATIDLKTR